MSEVFYAAGLIAAFWMGYLIGCGVRLALRAARVDLLDDTNERERRRKVAESAAPWAQEIADRLEREWRSGAGRAPEGGAARE